MERRPLVEDIQNYAQNIVDRVREPLPILDSTPRVQSANRAFYQTFHVSPAETEGRLIDELGNGQWDIPDLRSLLEDIVPKSSVFDDFARPVEAFRLSSDLDRRWGQDKWSTPPPNPCECSSWTTGAQPAAADRLLRRRSSVPRNVAAMRSSRCTAGGIANSAPATSAYADGSGGIWRVRFTGSNGASPIGSARETWLSVFHTCDGSLCAGLSAPWCRRNRKTSRSLHWPFIYRFFGLVRWSDPHRAHFPAHALVKGCQPPVRPVKLPTTTTRSCGSTGLGTCI